MIDVAILADSLSGARQSENVSAAADAIVKVNGEVADHFRTNNMIHGVAKFLSRMSQYLTLYPGDVVWMGTDGWPRNLKHGDTVDIEIAGIGTLRNPVVRESR